MGVTADHDDRDLDDDPFAAADAVVAALAEQHATPPPMQLRAEMLRVARSVRAVGAAADGIEVRHSAAEVYAEVRALVAGVLEELERLDPAPWSVTVPTYGWSAHELMGHLLAVERYTAALLGAGEFDAPAASLDDHLAFGRPLMDAECRGAPSATVARWNEASLDLARHAGGMDDVALSTQVVFNGVPLSARSLLIARGFELWAHMDDLCATAGLMRRTPRAASLRTMSDLSVSSLPLLAALAGRQPGPAHARVVLTGSGGGAWSLDIAGGGTDRAPDAVVVADVVDYCRLAARRLARDEFRVRITGNQALAEDLLAGAMALAV